MEKAKVAIVGLGTVGAGVARLLIDFGDRTARHAGKQLWLEQIVVQDASKPRDVQVDKRLISQDLGRIANDPEIQTVALLVGGLEPARTIALKMLDSGKDLVTANKALLAEHGPELFDRARELGRSIAFEAAVAGGIPIIANISTCLSANQIESIVAILNGTSNYILTQMELSGASYSDAVRQAQQLGYAEADPSMDVDGSDAAQKLAILAHLSFGSRVSWNQIPRRGIDTLDVADIRFAKELGYRIKLLAVAQRTADGLEIHVSPTLVRLGNPLAEVRGASNAISVTGDAVGRLYYSGLGAGQMPTASAVVADMIDTVVGRAAITFRRLELWSNSVPVVAPRDYANVAGRYYLRFAVEDRPSVLAEIAGVLGKHGISIASVIQHEPDGRPASADVSGGAASANDAPSPSPGQSATPIVPLVIMTHRTTEGATSSAVGAIEQLNCLRRSCVRMRVLD